MLEAEWLRIYEADIKVAGSSPQFITILPLIKNPNPIGIRCTVSHFERDRHQTINQVIC